MKVRLYERERDYPLLTEWWKAHGWEPVIPEILPPLGAIMYEEQTDGTNMYICAGFLYMTLGCGFSFMEWVVSNPAATPMKSARGIVELVQFLKHRAAENDYGVMMTSSNNEGLIRLYTRAGFGEVDKNLTHLLMFTRN